MSKIQAFFRGGLAIGKEQTIIAQFVPNSMNELDNVIDGLCDPNTVDAALTTLRHYSSLGHKIILFDDQFAALFDVLQGANQPKVTTGILEFFELLVATRENFNLEGLSTPDRLQLLLLHFPIRSAIVIAATLVRSSFQTALLLFQCPQTTSFPHFLTENSVNLPDLIHFLAGFTFYSQFDNFSKRVVPQIFEFCSTELCLNSLDYLITASLNPNLRSFIAFSDQFPSVFDPSPPICFLQMKAVLLDCVLPNLPDIEPLLISHGDLFLEFLAVAFDSDSDVESLVDAADVCGSIAAVGRIYVERLRAMHLLDRVMNTLQRDLDFDAFSVVLVAASRFLVHSSIEIQTQIAFGGLFDALADALESLTDGALLQIVTVFERMRVAGNGNPFLEMVVNCEPFMLALEKMPESLVNDNLIGRLAIVIKSEVVDENG